ncbi:MAG: histidine phosphatase family protein [Chloroflexota bacterium]
MKQKPVTLLLARHGESEGNKPWTFLGRGDPPLTARGVAQAAQLSEKLSGEPLTAVYASPLKRAWETAVVAALPHQLEPIKTDPLIEQDYGRWEGLHVDQVAINFATDHQKWQQDAYHFGPTAGENLAQIEARLQNLLPTLAAKHAGKTVLWVAHGGTLNTLLCHLLQTPHRWLWAYHFNMASYTKIVLGPEGNVLMAFNA